MEYHFEVNRIPANLWVKALISHFDTRQFDEIHPIRKLAYSEFRREIVSMFRKPDLTQSKINELMDVTQEEDESIDTYMNRIKDLVQ